MNMDILHYCYLALLATIFLLYKIFFHHLLSNIFSNLHLQYFSKPKKNLPPSPPSLPILGHLHLFLSKAPIHRTLQALSVRYGPIFSLQMGRQPILVVSSPWAAEECLTQNDIIFANRPKFLMGQHLGYNHSLLIWAPYGHHWRNLRRMATITTLSQRRIQLGGPARTTEVHNMIRDLFRRSEDGTGEVDLNEVFDKLARNLVMRVVNGKCWESMMMSPPSNVTTVCDFLPVLRWVGYMGVEKEMILMQKEMDVFLQSLVDECRNERAFRRTGCEHGSQQMTLIGELLDMQEVEPDYYTDEILKGMILVMLLAGSDTLATTLEWAMSNLLNHPQVLKKAQVDIHTQVSKGNLIHDSDVPNLNYTLCIIKETLRLYPPAPLLIPHYSSQDCTIGGYHVPKDTMLFINAWALQRDADYWEESDKFRPERFEKDGNYNQGFKFMPFGMGRRACPGINFALRNVTLVLASLVQCFEWKNFEYGDVDLNEQVGSIIMHKEKPLKAICTPRSCMKDVLAQI